MGDQPIGIKDINYIEIKAGDEVEIRFPSWNGKTVICRGIVEYRANDTSCYGCGYGVNDLERGFTYLSCISRSSTQIVLTGPGDYSL
ncbi:hypothetical protein [Paenibacillus sp. FSL R10-2734]|uniref:hypothetical protein n=1 Tax=Paenibacillus sp. FSL R10-2734 TaxID=2954691 RepID=UPI0030D6E5B2